MNCEYLKELLPEYWDSLLDEVRSREVSAHLAGCPECRAEGSRLKALWFRLGAIPEESPALEARDRFEAMLSRYEKQERDKRSLSFSSFADFIETWWPRRTAAQMAISAGCLAIGILLGYAITVDVQGSREAARLRTEVSATRQLVALSLLRQQAATDRLKGIDWSSQIARPEPQVVRALVETVNYDDTVNVRLAAVDALRRLNKEPAIQSELAAALQRQDSPMVQIALIDALSEVRSPTVHSAIVRLQAGGSVNPVVRSHARAVLETMR